MHWEKGETLLKLLQEAAGSSSPWTGSYYWQNESIRHIFWELSGALAFSLYTEHGAVGKMWDSTRSCFVLGYLVVEAVAMCGLEEGEGADPVDLGGDVPNRATEDGQQEAVLLKLDALVVPLAFVEEGENAGVLGGEEVGDGLCAGEVGGLSPLAAEQEGEVGKVRPYCSATQGRKQDSST